MASNEYMQRTPLREVTTGWCNIQTPDTTYWKGGKQRTKDPQWKVEVLVDRENQEMMDFFSKCRQHLRDHGEEVGDTEEPWVRVQPEKTKKDKDGNNVTYPSYEYISVMTTEDPHEKGVIWNDNNEPFTDEVWKNSLVSLAISPRYDTVHQYMLTFYLEGLKVHRNGSNGGGGGGNGREAAMQMLGVPSVSSLTKESGGNEDAPFDPSQL